ncbi:MAG: hypothetical protein ACE5Q3_12030 [Alphaproteobacteria bacterium]
MRCVRVLIGTTEGPAEVQRITEEDPNVQSVICLDGKALALPVSPAYEAFVRRPTGLIEAAYGHPSFRIDVSAPIDEGVSWQLGVLLAHALRAEGRLCEGDAPPDHVFWVTGEVDRDLNVFPVDRVGDKIQRSISVVSELRASGIPVTIVVPLGNLGELDDRWLAEQGLGSEGCDVLAVDGVGELFARLALPLPQIVKPQPRPEAAPAEDGERPRRRRGRLVGLGAGLAVVLATLLIASQVREERAVAPDGGTPGTHPSAPVQLSATLSRSPDGASCAAVRLGRTTADVDEVVLRPGPPTSTGEAEGLCALSYEVRHERSEAVLWLFATRAVGDRARLDAKTIARGEPLGPGRPFRFDMPLPRGARDPLEHRFLLVTVAGPQAGDDDRLERLADALGDAVETDVWLAARDALAADGYSTVELVHQLNP